MKLLKKVSIVLVFAMLILTTKSNAATEKIYSYESDIYIQEDSSILVEEKITVYAEDNAGNWTLDSFDITTNSNY